MDGGNRAFEDAWIDRSGLERLLSLLAEQQYRVVGPTVRDGAIVYDDIATVADLPEGWKDAVDGFTNIFETRLTEAIPVMIRAPRL